MDSPEHTARMLKTKADMDKAEQLSPQKYMELMSKKPKKAGHSAWHTSNGSIYREDGSYVAESKFADNREQIIREHNSHKAYVKSLDIAMAYIYETMLAGRITREGRDTIIGKINATLALAEKK